MPGYDVKLRLWRGDSDGGGLVDYTVEVEEGMVVLDAVHRVQATQAGDLAVRWNCKAGKCGSCSAEVNGIPKLMCMTRLSEFDRSEAITVTPMRTFPVIRDLVTDVSYNYEVASRLPAFAPKPREADGTYRMQQQDVERLQEFRKCIECFLCQNTCHVIRDHDENKPAFAGPRFFIRYAELDMHPLDTLDRRKVVQEEMGLGYCNITKCCTEVCPEHIKITDNGIIPLKERVIDTKYDPVVWLGSKIFRRGEERSPASAAPPKPPRAGSLGADPSTLRSVADAGSGGAAVATATATAPATLAAAPPAVPSSAVSSAASGGSSAASGQAIVEPAPYAATPAGGRAGALGGSGSSGSTASTGSTGSRASMASRALPVVGGLAGVAALIAVLRRRRR